MPATIRIILGSVRAGRLCPFVAEWIAELGREATGLECSLLDLKERHLPMDDEPAVPAHGEGYSQPHTKAWSQEVKETSAFVIVTPQYNGGIPAPLKNAMDHLYGEWEGKPVLNVTYGGQGGTKCGEQLRQLTTSLNMRLVDISPALVLPKAVLEEDAKLDPVTAFAEAADLVREGFGELAAMLRTTG